MKSSNLIYKVLLAASSLIVGIAAFAFSQGFSSDGTAADLQDKSDKLEKDEKPPIALYSASLPTDPVERELRIIRNNRYDKLYPFTFEQSPPEGKELHIHIDWIIQMPALPSSESDAVILGEIVDAKGYISNDKTGAYSEFSIRIVEVFKDDRSSLAPENSIIAERVGATVQLPSGRTILYSVAGKGLPSKGHKYVLFLKYNNDGEDYSILTGYQLHKNLVQPLDPIDPFISYSKSEAGNFLKAVRTSLDNKHEKRKPKQ